MKIGSFVVPIGNNVGISNNMVYTIIEMDVEGKFVKVDNYNDIWYNLNTFTEISSKDSFFHTLLKSVYAWEYELSKGNHQYKYIVKEMQDLLQDSRKYI